MTHAEQAAKDLREKHASLASDAKAPPPRDIAGRDVEDERLRWVCRGFLEGLDSVQGLHAQSWRVV